MPSSASQESNSRNRSPASSCYLPGVWAFVATALLPFCGLGQGIEYETMSGLIDRGVQAFAQGDYSQAAGAFNKLQTLYSHEEEWARVRLNETLLPIAGYAALKAGLYDQAIASLQLFLEEEDTGPEGARFANYVLAASLKQKGHFDQALEAFATFRALTPSLSQQGIARIHEADIFLKSKRPDEALSLLEEVASSDAAVRVKTQARLLSLKEWLQRENWAKAAQALFSSNWDSSEMPELAMLAFLSIEAGDAFLQNDMSEAALKAYQLVPSKTVLVQKQSSRLQRLQESFAERRSAVGMGGVMWTDFYEQLIRSANAQLQALEAAEDYSEALLLRRGQASLRSGRHFEAWLLFERLARHAAGENAERGHFNWIIAAKEMGRFSGALDIAKAYLEQYKDSSAIENVLYLMAETLMESQNYQAALETLSEIAASASDPNLRVACLFQRGQCRMQLADYHGAQGDFESAAASSPDPLLQQRGRLWAGISLFLNGAFEEALTRFEALQTDAENSEIKGEARYQAACCLYSLSNYKEAIARLNSFAQEHSLHGRSVEAQLLLGDSHYAVGQFKKAIDHYRNIPAELPELAHLAALQISFAYVEMGQSQAALSTLQRHSDLEKDPYRLTETRLIHAELLLEQGEDEAARKSLDLLIAQQGNAPEAENILDALQLRERIQRGDPVSAREEALRNNRECLAARLLLVEALELKRAKRPFQSKERFLELANAIPASRLPPECLAYLGVELAQLDFPQGPELLERLLSEYPDSRYKPFAYFGLALRESEAKRFSLALGWLERISESAADSPVYIDALALQGVARTQLGEYDPAQAAFERVLSLRWATSQQKANALLGLADLKARQGNLKQSVAYGQRVFTLYPGIADASATAYLKTAQRLAALEEERKALEVLEEFLSRPEYAGNPQLQKAQTLAKQLREKGHSDPKIPNES